NAGLKAPPPKPKPLFAMPPPMAGRLAPPRPPAACWPPPPVAPLIASETAPASWLAAPWLTKELKSKAYCTHSTAIPCRAVMITVPVVSTPRKQAINKMTVFQNKFQKQRVITPSTQLGKAWRSLSIGQTQSAAAIGPIHHR